MPKTTEKSNKKVAGIMCKLRDDKFYNEFLEMAKDEMQPFGRQTEPNEIASGVADVNSMKSFMEVDFFEIPAGIRCPICWDTVSFTRKLEGRRVCRTCQEGKLPKFKKGIKRPINLFILPPLTSSPINFIITIQRQSVHAKISSSALQLLLDFVTTCPTLPNSHGYVQFVMPPIGSVGSGLASYRDMSNELNDEKDSKYSPICDLLYMLTAVIRNHYDKVTIVASTISSITCKPSNLIELLKDFGGFQIPPTDISFILCGFEKVDGSVSSNPFSLTGTEMLQVFKNKQETPWIKEIKLNCFARTFVDGLGKERNLTGILGKFLSPDEIIIIQNKIMMIELEDKEEIRNVE